MNRCLHITIQENSGATPRRATAYFPGRTGTDPGEDHVMPKPDDPTDPGEDNLMPKPDDPRDPSDSGYGSYGGHGGPGGYREASANVHSCCCGCGCGAPAGTSPTSSTGTTTPHPFIAPRDFSGFVIVRMAPGIDPDAKSLWDLAGPPEAGPPEAPRLPGLKAVLNLPFEDEECHLTSRPLVELHQADGGPVARDTCLFLIRELEKQTALTAFPPLQSLTTYWRLDLRGHPGLVEEMVAQLNLLAEVDLAYRELSANDPQDEADGRLFAEDQGYLNDAPAGISASWAWKGLAAPASSETPTSLLTICDLEQGWNPEHNYLNGENVLTDFIYGENRDQKGTPGHHGTAVLGQLAAAGRFRGAAPGLGRFVLASHYLSKDKKENNANNQQPHPFAGTNGNVASALVQTLGNYAGPLVKGDILLLEVQRGLLPAEVDEADFNAIRLASGLGVLVIEAAGNGGFDLDAFSDPATGRSLRRGDPRFRDSGAVLVGAARASVPHDRVPFSNYGSRLDCYGWGEAVTTCGYGDLSGTNDNDLYTNSFSGTSSASAIVTGAAALLQALHTKQTGFGLEPRAMRALLSDSATGTPQGPNVRGHIGVMPDLKAILHERLQIVPVVYMRRSVCDDGSKPGPDDEISSSPDIFLWKEDLTATNTRYGEERGENLPSPGDPMVTANLNDALNNHIYVRMRNRGIGNGSAHVQLFASPAATLITPERWIPWGRLDAANLPQGDTSTVVAGPVSPMFKLTSPPSSPGTPWSLLAVLSPYGENGRSGDSNYINWMAGLPPGSPYFDWTQYRAFLRQQGVAWRNTHRVTGTGTNLSLPFFIAGTPDRARLFDFEVIQRLPEGATLTLQVLTALDAKLRQRQPWLGDRAAPLFLPKRPRTAIQGVALAAGAYADASFTVQAAADTLKGSHSLAIRQLWRGEEVGRITWYFGLDN